MNKLSCLLSALLLFTISASAQRFVRAVNTVEELITVVNPADPNTNAFVVSTASVWTFLRGSSDPTNTSDTIASLYPGAISGNWRNQAQAFFTNSTVILGNTNVFVITVPSVAALKALNPCGGLGGIELGGYAQRGDGGGSFMEWFSGDPTPEDGLMNFRLNNEGNCPGVWRRIFPNGYFTGLNILLAGPEATNYTYVAVRDFAATVGFPPIIWPRRTNEVDTVSSSLGLISRQSMGQEDGGSILGNGTNAVFHGSGISDFTIQGLTISGGLTGVWLENCTNGIVTGCTFIDMTNGVVFSGRNIRVYGNTYINVGNHKNDPETGDYVPVSVLKYGADPTGLTDSSAAFAAALATLPFDQGGEIIVPPGKYAVNVSITNRNASLRGFSSAGDSLNASVLVPWNTNNPVLYVGNDGANTSITNYAQGVAIRGLFLSGAGPNGRGKVGLHVDGGSYKNAFYNITTFDFAEYGLKVTPGVNKETLYNEFHECRFEHCDNGIAAVGILGKLAPSINDLHFFGGNMTGCTTATNKPAIIIDSASPEVHGVWIQGGSYSGVKLLKSFAPYPRLIWHGGNIECTGPAPIVAVENAFETNRLYGASIIGDFSVNGGNHWMSMDGVPVAFLPGGVLADRTMLVQPALWNSLYFQQSGTNWTNIQTEAHIERANNILNIANSNMSFGLSQNGDLYFDSGPSALLNFNLMGNDKIAPFVSDQRGDQLLTFYTAPSAVSIGPGRTNVSRTNSFFYIPTVNGTPTGVPYNPGGPAYAAQVFDFLNNRLYFYNFQDNAWHLGGGAGGTNQQVFFNDLGSQGSSPDFLYNRSSHKISLGNITNTANKFEISVTSGGATFLNSFGDASIQANGGSILLSGTSMQFAEVAHTIGSGTTPLGTLFTLKVMWDNANNVFDAEGNGTPEGVVQAGIGSTFRRHDGGANTCFYVKETGANTVNGWVGK